MKRLSLGLRPLLLALLASLLALALSELGLRAAAALGGDDFEPAALRAELERAAELPRGDEEQAAAALRPEPELGENRTFLHPYTGYETRNGLREVLWQAEFAAHADSLAELPESARPYTILVLGGSLAELFGDPSNGGVERMAEVLRADERYRARELVFLNHGRPAFKQPQPLLLFAYLLQLGIEPDAVLVLDGFNEVGLGLLNTGYGAHPAMPSYYHWGHLSQTSAAHGPQARAVWIAEERVREERLVRRLDEVRQVEPPVGRRRRRVGAQPERAPRERDCRRRWHEVDSRAAATAAAAAAAFLFCVGLLCIHCLQSLCLIT